MILLYILTGHFSDVTLQFDVFLVMLIYILIGYILMCLFNDVTLYYDDSI